MKLLNIYLLILLMNSFCTASFAKSLTATSVVNRASVSFEKPADNKQKAIQAQIKSLQITKPIIEFINDTFILSTPLVYVFGGNDGPLYDSETNEILLPYAFYEDVKARFSAVKYSESGLTEKDATADALMHTMFHELGHALIFMHDLPIVGKEEDAADSLATILLIEYFEDGQEIAISAADLFDLESEDRTTLTDEDFWDEHSLDEQRYYSTLCHVYGSAPEKYKHLIVEGVFDDDRATLCIQDYNNSVNGWHTLLSPYFKGDK